MVRELRSRLKSTATTQQEKKTGKMKDSDGKVKRGKKNETNLDNKQSEKSAQPEAPKRSLRLQLKKHPEKPDSKKSQEEKASKFNDIFAFDDPSPNPQIIDDKDADKNQVKKKKETEKQKLAVKKLLEVNISPVVKIEHLFPKTKLKNTDIKDLQSLGKKFFKTNPQSNAVVNLQDILHTKKRKPLKRLNTRRNLKKNVDSMIEEPKPQNLMDPMFGKGKTELNVCVKKEEQNQKKKADQSSKRKKAKANFRNLFDLDENFDPTLNENQKISHNQSRTSEKGKSSPPLYQKFSPVPKIDSPTTKNISPKRTHSKVANFAQSTPNFPRKILGEKTNLYRVNLSPNKTWRMPTEIVPKVEENSEKSGSRQFLKVQKNTSSTTKEGMFMYVPKTPKHKKKVSRAVTVENFFGLDTNDGENSQEFFSDSGEKEMDDSRSKRGFNSSSSSSSDKFHKRNLAEFKKESSSEMEAQNEKEKSRKSSENEGRVKSLTVSPELGIFMDPFDALMKGASGMGNSMSPISFSDPMSSFREPPKHQYQRKRPGNFSHDKDEKHELETSKELEFDHRQPKKKTKQEKRVEEWVDSVNKTFEDIDHYELIVE